MADVVALSADDMARCKKLYADGYRWEDIAKPYGMHPQQLAKAVRRSFTWTKGKAAKDPCKGCKWLLNGEEMCILPRCFGK